MDNYEREMIAVVNRNQADKALARRLSAISDSCDLLAGRLNAISARRRRKRGLFGRRK